MYRCRRALGNDAYRCWNGLLLKQILCVGEGRCARPRVNAARLLMTYLVMNRLLLPVLVPISPYKTTLKSEHADLSYKNTG